MRCALQCGHIYGGDQMTTLTRETIQVPRNWFHQHWVRTGASALPGREVTQRDWDGRFYREECLGVVTRDGERFRVDPDGTEWRWTDKPGKIPASYSADRVSEGKPIRQPIKVDGRRFVSMGGSSADYERGVAYVYEVVRREHFEGSVWRTIADKNAANETRERVKLKPGEEAYADSAGYCRSDPLGFYHGIGSQTKSESLVIQGPIVKFVADDHFVEPTQLELF